MATNKNLDQICEELLKQEAEELSKDEMRKNLPNAVAFRQKENWVHRIDTSEPAFLNNYPEDCFVVNRLTTTVPKTWIDLKKDPKYAFIEEPFKDIRFNFKPNLRNRKFIFRGQTAYYKDCTPSLFRNKKQKFYLAEMIKVQEMQALMMTHPLFRLFQNGIDLAGDKYVFEMNLYGLAQHYYQKTALMDLTSNIDVAKFFACCEYDSKTHGYKPVLDSKKHGVIYYYSLDMPNIFQYQLNDYLTKLSTIGLQVFPRSGNQHGFLLQMPKGVNFNNLHKVRCKYFKHDPVVSQRVYDEFGGGKKLFPVDILENHYLEHEHDDYVSSVAVQINRSMNLDNNGMPINSYDEVVAMLGNIGIKVKEYIPQFSDNEMDIYYDTIKAEWLAFVDRIHFCGKYDDLLRDALLHISDRDEYKWAFER